jgi:hypothetical protein
LDGHSVLVATYGETAATATEAADVDGNNNINNNNNTLNLAERLLDQVFGRLERSCTDDEQITIRLAVVEMYLNHVHHLICPVTTTTTTTADNHQHQHRHRDIISKQIFETDSQTQSLYRMCTIVVCNGSRCFRSIAASSLQSNTIIIISTTTTTTLQSFLRGNTIFGGRADRLW